MDRRKSDKAQTRKPFAIEMQEVAKNHVAESWRESFQRTNGGTPE